MDLSIASLKAYMAQTAVLRMLKKYIELFGFIWLRVKKTVYLLMFNLYKFRMNL